jgi:hypothetical protein
VVFEGTHTEIVKRVDIFKMLQFLVLQTFVFLFFVPNNFSTSYKNQVTLSKNVHSFYYFCMCSLKRKTNVCKTRNCNILKFVTCAFHIFMQLNKNIIYKYRGVYQTATLCLHWNRKLHQFIAKIYQWTEL